MSAKKTEKSRRDRVLPRKQDTSSCDVAPIWIGEEATNQIGEFLQPAHGSNGFASEVSFGLVDTGATMRSTLTFFQTHSSGLSSGE
jgi:hypothetical protein